VGGFVESVEYIPLFMNNITNEELEGKFGMLLTKKQTAQYLSVCIATVENWK
jgi:hypothetical protein